MFQIDLIRHGRTPGNEAHRYVGITDEGLSCTGRRELESLGRDKQREPMPERVFLSPLQRCRESARLLFPGVSQVLIPDFRETDFGSFEYHTYEELKDNPAYQAWIASAGQTECPGGESRDRVRKRIIKGWQVLCREMKSRQLSHAALVAHGGTLMELLALYGEPKKSYYDWQTACGHGYSCRWNEKEGRLMVQTVWPPKREKRR